MYSFLANSVFKYTLAESRAREADMQNFSVSIDSFQPTDMTNCQGTQWHVAFKPIFNSQPLFGRHHLNSPSKHFLNQFSIN